MSGGHFDYIDSRAKDEIFGYGDKWWNVFEYGRRCNNNVL